MNNRLFTWSFVIMATLFSLFLSYVTNSLFFLLLAVFPIAGKMMLGPRPSNAPEAVFARRRQRKMIYLIALAIGIGAMTATLITQDGARTALASAAGIVFLVVLYGAMIMGAGRSIDHDHDDKYG